MKKLLVPVDGSPVAPLVLSAAVDYARGHGATITLMRVVSLPTELPVEAYAMTPDDVTGLLIKGAEADLARAAEAIPEALRAGTRVELGAPWRAICDVATEEDVDVIVMGAHGHKLLDTLLGTTTGRVVTHSDRSVFVVRPKPEKTSKG
ncbi:MAG: universal stress protein [Polyangiales bacterium]